VRRLLILEEETHAQPGLERSAQLKVIRVVKAVGPLQAQERRAKCIGTSLAMPIERQCDCFPVDILDDEFSGREL
jgi:hypothetical protein